MGWKGASLRARRAVASQTTARTAQSGERTRPGCSFPRLAENTGRTEIVRVFPVVSRATAERGARSATPGAGVLPGRETARTE